MRVTRLMAKKFGITAIDNFHIQIEDDGVYRLTMCSLTGKGTHTKWFYPGTPQHKELEEREFVPRDERRRAVVNVQASFDHFSYRSHSRDMSRETTLEPEAGEETDEGVFSDPSEVRGGSVATELVDEDAATAPRKLHEEPLPDLPYGQIMKRISKEPTLILSDEI